MVSPERGISSSLGWCGCSYLDKLYVQLCLLPEPCVPVTCVCQDFVFFSLFKSSWRRESEYIWSMLNHSNIFKSIQPSEPSLFVFLRQDYIQWLALRALLHATPHVLDLVCACRLQQLKPCKLHDTDQKSCCATCEML